MKIYLQSKKCYRKVQEVYLSGKNLHVLGVRIFPQIFISIENLTTSAQFGLIVKKTINFSSPPPNSITSKSLRHLPVFTESGEYLGKLQKLNYSKDLFQVSAIVVKPKFKKLLHHSNLIISRTAIVSLTKTKIIVIDSKIRLPNTSDAIFSQLARPAFPA